MNLDRHKLERILADEVERARAAFEAAKATFVTVTSDVPSSIPQPDGSFRLERAGHDFRTTIEEYSQVLHEFNNFIIDGTVPDRLQQLAPKP